MASIEVDQARAPGSVRFEVPLRESRCGECDAVLPADAVRCPGCCQVTGPFTPLLAVGVVATDEAGQVWLHTAVTDSDDRVDSSSHRSRRLTAEQARWISRYAGEVA